MATVKTPGVRRSRMATALAVIALIGATVGSGEPASAGPQGRSPGDLLIPRASSEQADSEGNHQRRNQPGSLCRPDQNRCVFLVDSSSSHIYRLRSAAPTAPEPNRRKGRAPRCGSWETLRSYLANQEPPRFPGRRCL